MTSTALVWLRRDLRLADQPALHQAAAQHEHVVPVYVHAPEEDEPWPAGAASRWWLHHSLSALAAAFARRGLPLIVRRGESLATLKTLARESGAEAVYWNRLYEPAALARDARVEQGLRAAGLATASFNGALLFEPWELQTHQGKPYRVYTPMFKSAAARFELLRSPLPAPRKLSGSWKALRSDAIESLGLLPNINWDAAFHRHWRVGEKAALRKLDGFAAAAIADYKAHRDLPAFTDAASRLSPHLHFGEISPLQALSRARQAEIELRSAGAHTSIQHFIKELFWREFSHHLLYHFPQTPQAPMNPKFERFPWRKRRDYAGDLAAWQRGRTGIPIVDAGMRELWITGVMHNRVRMIAASFLTKNLLIPWQEGAAWFWDTLVDADLAQNTLGWQWVAGSGADAAPYFRIFSPLLQGEKFDPDGAYVRRWLPALATLPKRWVHQPWQAPLAIRLAAGIADDSPYARPIVELPASRDRALAAYRQLRSGEVP